ncbi:MAG TPA: lipase family protein [Polyangiales bacterium]
MPARESDVQVSAPIRRLIDPNCVEDGCIRRLFSEGSYKREAIEHYLDPCVTIDNGYTIVVIEYVTRGRTSLANVTIPYPRDVPAGGYHVVVNAHGTVGLDDACRTADTIYGTGLAGLFGARGMIGIAPDYPGLGTPGPLPYLVSNSEGAAVLDAMRAARAVAALLDIPLSQRYAAVGLSEGGHAVLAAAAMHADYAPDLDVRAFAAAAPASAWFEHWQLGAADDGEHIAYHAMLFYAWSRYYGYQGPSLWAPRVAERIDSVMMHDCSFDFGRRRDTYLSELGTSAQEIFAPEFLRAYRGGKLPPSAAVFEHAFAINRIGPYAQTAPLAIWQGDADTTVPETITAELVAALRAGGVTLDYHVVKHGTHFNTAFGFVAQHQLAMDASLRWVREQLDR